MPNLPPKGKKSEWLVGFEQCFIYSNPQGCFFWHPSKFHPRAKRKLEDFSKVSYLPWLQSGVHNVFYRKGDIQISFLVPLVVWSDVEGQVLTAGPEKGKILLCFKGGNETGENIPAGGWVVNLDC